MAGFRIDPTHEGPQFYTLLAVGGDNERPLDCRWPHHFLRSPHAGAQGAGHGSIAGGAWAIRRARSRPSATWPRRSTSSIRRTQILMAWCSIAC